MHLLYGLVVLSLFILCINAQDIPTNFPSVQPTKEPTISTSFASTKNQILPNHDISSQETQTDFHSAMYSPQWAVYILLLITLTLIFVIVSILLYKRCLESKPSKNGYTTPASDDLEGSQSDREHIGGGFHPKQHGINFYVD